MRRKYERDENTNATRIRQRFTKHHVSPAQSLTSVSACQSPRLHYRLLTLCPAPTDPVGQSWPRTGPALAHRASVCMCQEQSTHQRASSSTHPRVSSAPRPLHSVITRPLHSVISHVPLHSVISHVGYARVS